MIPGKLWLHCKYEVEVTIPSVTGEGGGVKPATSVFYEFFIVVVFEEDNSTVCLLKIVGGIKLF